MQKPILIIFTGIPGTGKTTLSTKVSSELGLPLLAKDAIKEIMYDTIGWSDKAFSAKLAHATLGIMEYVAAQQLKARNSLVIESNYTPKLVNAMFRDWQMKYRCTIVQVVCRTDVDVLAARSLKRTETDRHPGHHGHGTLEDYAEDARRRIANGESEPIDVHGKVIIVDTTDFDAVSISDLVDQIRMGEA